MGEKMGNATFEIYRLIQNGKFHKALLLAEEDYQHNKESQEALVNYVSILLKKLKHLDMAESVLISDPRKPTSSLSIYLLYQDLYTLKGDVASLNKLQKINPSFTIPENIEVLAANTEKTRVRPDKSYFKYQLLDMLRLLSNKYPEATHVFKKAYNLISQNEINKGEQVLHKFAHKSKDKILGRFIFAELELLEGKFKIAKKWYKKILGDFREEWLIYNRLGDICLALGNEEEAENHYLKANELNPDDIDTNLDLIRTYILKKDFKRAKKVFNQASVRFGKERLKSLHQVIENKDEVSTGFYVKGLCWYEGGGDVFNIEMETKAGSGEIKPTGNLGFSLLDSIHIAHVVAKKIAFQKGLQADNRDILVNMPTAIIYKDGASAGLAFAMGIIGKLLSKPIPENVAFTGEVALNGTILPIGGLDGKLTAAFLSNIQTVYMPRKNFYMLQGVPEKIKSNLKLKLADRVKNVAEDLWSI